MRKTKKEKEDKKLADIHFIQKTYYKLGYESGEKDLAEKIKQLLRIKDCYCD